MTEVPDEDVADLTPEELEEDGDDAAQYQPGHPDDDGQDADETQRPDQNKHED